MTTLFSWPSTGTTRLLGILMLCALGLGACRGEPPKLTERGFTRMQFYAGQNNLGTSIRDDIVKDINAATTTVDFAAFHLQDMTIAKALVDAHNRGVKVRFVGDEDSAGDAGYQAIKAANIPMSLGDGELLYLPEPTVTSILQVCFDTPGTIDPALVSFIQCTRRQGGGNMDGDGLMRRPGTMNQMTNTFTVIDGLVIYNFATPNSANEQLWVGWRAHSQEMAIGFSQEFQQMFGGVFATTLGIYNGPIKSTVHGAVYDSRIPSDRPGRYRQLLEGYLTDRGLMTIHFNPQQRLVKEMIDEIYRARGSVYIMTDEVVNDYVIDALRYKGAHFNVQLIVNANATIPERLQNSGVIIRRAPASLSYVPTVMLNNVSEGPGNKKWPKTLVVTSHSFYTGPPFRVFRPQELGEQSPDDIVRIYPSDLFVDGNMWMMRQATSQESTADNGEDVFEQFESFWNDVRNKSTEVQ